MIVQNQNDPHFSPEFVDEFYGAIPAEKTIRWIDAAADRSAIYSYHSKNPDHLVEWFDSQLNPFN